MCTSMAEDVFEMDEGKDGVKVKVKETVDLSKKGNQEKAKEAAEACPVEAIKISE
jgi:ferredoxin